MSFCRDVKEEIRTLPERRCCLQTLLRVFLRFSGDGKTMISFSGSPMARFLVSLLKRLEIHDWGMGIAKRGTDHAGKMILGRNHPFFSPLKKPRNICCRKSFLRGVFLCAGYLVHPQKGYRVEIVCRKKGNALTIFSLLRGMGYKRGLYKRRGNWLVLLKGMESMEKFLHLIGARQSLLRFEEIRFLKETKNEVRRRVNYDSANVKRMVAAATRQRKLLQQLVGTRAWRKLPAALRAAAEARLKYPVFNLQDLADKLHISKSALNHRLRRLEALLKESV